MAKKLQLSEIKVKSFVPVVDAAEQRTAKGGYVNINRVSYLIGDIGGNTMWTEDKVTKSLYRVTSEGRGLKPRG